MSDTVYKQALPPGFAIGSYRIVRVLGVGGFGVTYLCEHSGLGIQVAVKEYLPNEVAVREGAEVHPKSAGDREGFEWGLSRFLDEARTLAHFKHPNVVRVSDCFEANNTAYIVMDYENGESLDVLLKRHGTLTEAQLKRVLLPLADGLRQVHAAGFLHRDIKPANVFVRRADESPVLLDFGSARQALGRKSKSVTAIASAGYSPPEQYETDSEQGPWTDIYALSALCHRAIIGQVPIEAPRRQGDLLRSGTDPLPTLSAARAEGFSRTLLEAVDWGLQVIEKERPQSVDEWLTRLHQHSESLPTAPSIVSSRWSRIQRGFRAKVRTALGRSLKGRRAPRSRPASQLRLLGPTEYLHILIKYLATGLKYLAKGLKHLVSGKLGLGKTFWLIGIGSGLIGLILIALSELDNALRLWRFASIGPSSIAAALLDLSARYSDGVTAILYSSPRRSRSPATVPVVILLVWLLVTKVGIWKAASAYAGPIGWARLAKAHTVADVLITAIVLSSALLYVAAGQGHTHAQALLGHIAAYQGRERIAAKWGNADAQYKMGSVAEDPQEAVTWYRKAAEQGHPDAQNSLAIMYYNGRGVDQNDREAANWVRKAAEQGHRMAQFNLGFIYAEGIGFDQDHHQATNWFAKAAEQGHPTAQYRLGVKYAEGRGVPKDVVKAYAWLSLAMEDSDLTETAEAARSDLKVTPQEIREAQRLSQGLVD